MATSREKLDRFLERIKESKDIPTFNKKKIIEFVEDRKAKGNKPNTIIKLLLLNFIYLP